MACSTTHSRIALFALAFAALTAGCEEQGAEQAEDDGASCEGAKCDDAEDGIVADLRSIDDPVAQFLADNVDEDGVLQVEYLDLLRGVGKLQGCGATDEEVDRTIDSYVISDKLVVQRDVPFPRIVNTVCSDDRSRADQAFFALSFGNEDLTDIDPLRIEMFAWDATEKRFRFYKTEDEGGDAVLTIDPAECADCHLAGAGTENFKMPMTPIMNELAAPWEHWHAEPIAVAHEVPDELNDAPVYSMLAGNRSASERSPFLKSAARLEQTIRSAFNTRVAVTRAGVRRVKPADVETAMSALRPLFCDEQVTYMTEDGSSGLIGVGAAIDGGWHSVFEAAGVGQSWEWLDPPRQIRLPSGGGEPISMLPTRGDSVLVYEKQLVSLRGIKADQLARIRALDWHTPVMSDFRCGLFNDALPRVIANPPIEITESTRVKALFAPLLDEILQLRPDVWGIEGEHLPDSIPIVASDEGNIPLLATAEPALLREFAEALAQGALGDSECDPATTEGFCEHSLLDIGALIQTRVETVRDEGRTFLQSERDSRACLARERYGAFPFVADLFCD